jgi:hypothetical protein
MGNISGRHGNRKERELACLQKQEPVSCSAPVTVAFRKKKKTRIRANVLKLNVCAKEMNVPRCCMLQGSEQNVDVRASPSSSWFILRRFRASEGVEAPRAVRQ